MNKRTVLIIIIVAVTVMIGILGVRYYQKQVLITNVQEVIKANIAKVEVYNEYANRVEELKGDEDALRAFWASDEMQNYTERFEAALNIENEIVMRVFGQTTSVVERRDVLGLMNFLGNLSEDELLSDDEMTSILLKINFYNELYLTGLDDDKRRAEDRSYLLEGTEAMPQY